MMKSSQNNSGIQPIVTFLSIVIVGIIIAQYVIPTWKVLIILLSFVLGGFIAGIEFNRMIKSTKKSMKKESLTKEYVSEEEKQQRLAKYVANLFDEDIPFDQLQKNNNQSIES